MTEKWVNGTAIPSGHGWIDCIIVGSGIHGSSDLVQLPPHMQLVESITGAMNVEAFLFLVGSLLFAGLLALLYWGYWNARKLDRQIMQGDPSLYNKYLPT